MIIIEYESQFQFHCKNNNNNNVNMNFAIRYDVKCFNFKNITIDNKTKCFKHEIDAKHIENDHWMNFRQ